ncbi:TetR/AcrR family transcriptional regulator [Mycolicibacterium arseniciresistens]|uniref:TetR/AcrR family transcriptional regulator n=1 Tax=Mycolicibacterium arseniciresistens TaxID=3062257 RepID=A0ABT8U8Y9_9MYCO|nr:TetR/AcrR family transcriptional regulator [Mycolicibacterium arseniciresistens]MDO3634250.1 TetR/AcrR family transcriptional regulator [Mycolicibacterium arseniciresistens]
MYTEARPPRLRGRPRASENTDTRAGILRSARDVFRELGYEGTTNMKIATHAGLTRPAINYHFTSKRELFRTVVEANLAILAQAIGAAADQVTLRDRLRTLMLAADTDPEVRAATGFLTVAELDCQRHPELRADGWDVASALRDFLRTSVAAARETGELHAGVDLPSVVDALHAVLSGMAFRGGAVADGRRRAQTEALMALVSGDLFTGPSGDRRDEPVRLG